LSGANGFLSIGLLTAPLPNVTAAAAHRHPLPPRPHQPRTRKLAALAGVSEADQWMRKNPKQAAQIATRWILGLKPEIAEATMQLNIRQADRRLSDAAIEPGFEFRP
jgi:hypothetical protein